MGRHNQRSAGGYGRNKLRSQNDYSRENYFIPSFSIRRQAEQNEELFRFLKGVQGVLGRTYRVFDPTNVSMTIIEQSKMIERLRDAKEKVDPTKSEKLALSIADSLRTNLENSTNNLRVPIGIIDTFGRYNNKLGFIPRGWKGFNGRYARENHNGEKLPLGIIVDENRLAVGGLATAFAHNKSLVWDGITRTPHASFAVKRKGKIHKSEYRDISSELVDLVDDMNITELSFNDPVIYPKYEIGQLSDPIYVRLDDES